MPRKRPTPAQQINIRGRRALPAEPRPAPARITCESCGREQWADGLGQPRAHLRAAAQNDPDFSEDVPVMVECRPVETQSERS